MKNKQAINENNYFTTVLIFSIIIYIMGSFWFASLNISKWSEDARGVLGWFWLIMNVIWLIVYLVNFINFQKQNKL